MTAGSVSGPIGIGRHQEVYDAVYRKRILRENESFSVHKLGALGADLAAVSQFFDPPWSRPVTVLTAGVQAFPLNAAGFRLGALGRLREAAGPMHEGLQTRIVQEDWKNAAIGASNLSGLFLTLGDIAQAQSYATQSVELAERSQDTGQRIGSRETLADALHQAGHQVEAVAAFREAERLQQEMQPAYPWLYSLGSFQYCELLLSQGRMEEVRLGRHRRWHG
jgi:tetratricopeptide (TPR) repeat protein